MKTRRTSRPLAYEDPEFLDSDEALPVRILAEYLGPLQVFREQRVQDAVVFMGSARIGEHAPMGRYYAEARELAGRLTQWASGQPGSGHRFLVCTGGGPGIMEAANRGASEAGGRSIGLNIGLPTEQLPNPFITEDLNFEFHYFFMRKLWFAHLAAAAVFFPGGFGTLDELCEFLTLSQTRKTDRHIQIYLYGSEFWQRTLDLEALARDGVISTSDLGLFELVDTPERAFEHLRAYLEGLPNEPPGPPEVPRCVRPE